MISKKLLVLVVSHNLDLANQYADRILHLDKGNLVKDEIKEKVLDDDYNDFSNFKKKYKLPFKRISNYVRKNISVHKLSTAMIVLLISLLVSFLTIITFISNFDRTKYAIINLKHTNNQIVSIKYYLEDNQNTYNDKGLKVEQVDYLTDLFPEYKFYPIYKMNFNISISDNQNTTSHNVSGIIETSENLLEYLGLNKLEGKLPEKNEDYVEIAITDYFYQLVHSKELIIEGYNVNVNSFSDIKDFMFTKDNVTYKIVGMIDTKYSDVEINYNYLKELINKNEIHNALFTYEGFYNDVILRDEEDIFKVLNGNYSYYKLYEANNTSSSSVNIEYIKKARNDEDIIFAHGYDKLDKSTVVISYQDLEKMFLRYYNLLSVTELIEKFAYENYDSIKEEFEKDHGPSSYYTYSIYINYYTVDSDNKYQPGYNFEYFMREKIKDLISNNSLEVELKYLNNVGDFSKKYKVIGVIRDEKATGCLYVSEDVYDELLAYNDGEYAFVVTRLMNESSDYDLMKYIFNDSVHKGYVFSNGIAESIDIVSLYFNLLSSFYQYIKFILIAFTMLILFYLTNTILKNEKGNIALLIALGVRKVDIIKILFTELGFIVLLSLPFTLGGSYFLTSLLNNFIKSTLSVTANVCIYNVFTMISYYILSTLIFLIISVINIYKYAKISPAQVIKKEA